MAGGRNSTRQAILLERRNRAMGLRKEGLSYRSIAASLSKEFGEKYSHVAAFKDVDACLVDLIEYTRHDTEAYRQMELERLDELLKNLQEGIKSGDTKSIDSAIKVSDRRCKLLGLDAPIAVKIEEGIEFELRQFLEQLGTVLDHGTFQEVLRAYDSIQSRAGAAEDN